MSDIPGFPYHLLWGERQLVSVANLTRQDGLDFLKIAPQAGIRTETRRRVPAQRSQRGAETVAKRANFRRRCVRLDASDCATQQG